MTLPASLTVSFDFSSGPNFGIPLTLDDPINGKLGTGVLADNASYVVDLTSSTSKISIRGGRNIYQDQFETSSCVIRVLDPNSYFNPQNTSSPYYGKLQPLRKLRISADYAGSTYYLFSGYTQTYQYTYPIGQETGYVDITSSDAFRLFNMAAITTVSGAVDGDYTGTRIGQILDMLGWPTTMRTIATGNTKCGTDPGTTRTALSALKNAEFSEYGAFYMDSGGNAVFKSRSQVLSTLSASPTVFAQDGSGISYAYVKFAFDDKLIYNKATITRNGGTAQTAHSQSSIDTYFVHQLTQANLILQSDTDALNIALAYVASRKDTTIRIDEMTLDLMTNDYAAGITAALSMNYFSNIKITNNQPSGSPIILNLQIMGVDHEITPNTWTTTFTTMESIIDGFVLNSTVYGVLDQNVLAY